MSEEPKFTRVLTAKQRQSVSKLLSAVDQDGDGTLDEYELHSVLIANGILVPIDVVLALFHAADVNGDGQLSLEEFGQFVIGPESDGFQRKDLWKALRNDIDWWTNVNFILAGFLFVVTVFPEAFSVPTGEGSMAVSNLFLIGGAMYLCSGLTNLIRTPINSYKAEKSFEKTSKKLLDALNKNASKYTPLPPDVEEQAVEVQAAEEQEPQEQADVEEQAVEGQDTEVQAGEEQEPQEQAAEEKAIEEMGGADKDINTTHEDPVDTYIREEIFGSKKTMTKTDLGLLLLKKIGAYDDAVLTRMLHMVDDDNSGTIDVNEFQDCIKQLDPQSSLKGRLTKVALGCLKNLSWDCSLVFVSGLIITLLNNIFSRLDGINGLWDNKFFSPAHYANYAYVIGMLYFSIDRVTFLRGRYEMREEVRGMMRSWLTKDGKDETEDDDLSIEPEKMDKGKFNSLLEGRGIFVPTFMLESIYSSIDVDDSGDICYDEIEVYAAQKTNKFSEVAWSCIKDFPCWGNILWTVGCVAYLIAVYHPSARVDTICDQVGGITFFLGSINTTLSCVQGKIETLEYVDNVRKAISTLH